MRQRLRLRVATLVFVLPLALPAQAPAALPPAATVRRVLDSLASAFVTGNNTPGAAVAVVRGTDTLLFAGYGMANLETNTPVTTNTVFRIGSVTKQFASATVLQLVEQGSIALGDSIGQHVPDLPVAWRGTTITQLLNHTSGIKSYTNLGASWRKRWGEEMSAADLVQLTAESPPDFPRGSDWRYNNTGYVLLGMLIEAKTGRTWDAELTQRFLTPLGMTRSMYCENARLIPGRASGYTRGTPVTWVNAPHLSMTQPHAAGALCSTIGDLLTWNRALHGGTVLKAASYTAMTTPTGAAAKTRYGFGIGPEPLGGRTMITHSGGINGFLTDNIVIPEVGLSVTVLTNGDDTGPGKLARQLARAALGMPLELPPKPVTVTPAQLQPYTGAFDLKVDIVRVFTVFAKDGALFGQLAGQGTTQLIPLGEHIFTTDFDPDIRMQFTVEGGRATRLELRQGGGRFEGVRRP